MRPFRVLSELLHGSGRYQPGDTVELGRADADPLLALGRIEPLKAAARRPVEPGGESAGRAGT